jgi:hypothetical protein
MNTRKRQIIGGLLAGLGIALLPALAMANVPLLSIGNAYFVDTGVTRTSLQLHWPLIIPALPFLIGVLLILAPRRQKAT